MQQRLISDILKEDRQAVKSKRFRENCLIASLGFLFLAGLILGLSLPW